MPYEVVQVKTTLDDLNNVPDLYPVRLQVTLSNKRNYLVQFRGDTKTVKILRCECDFRKVSYDRYNALTSSFVKLDDLLEVVAVLQRERSTILRLYGIDITSYQ